MKREALWIVILVAAVFVCALTSGARPLHADGIGIYPTTIDFEDTVRGGEYFRSVGVINSGESNRVFRLTSHGETGQWLSFADAKDRTKAVDSITVPAGSEAHVLVRLLVPGDAANGTFTGTVRVVSRRDTGAEGGGDVGASVGVGAEISIGVEVTGTQKLAGSLSDVGIADVEIGSPIRIRATVRNDGNVQLNPTMDLEVVDDMGNVVGRATFPQEAVYPEERKVLVAEWDTSGQTLGERLARVSVKCGDLLLGSKEAKFYVLEVGTLTRRGELQGLELTNVPKAGDVAKLAVTFRNTGEIDTHSKFVGELYQGSRLIDVVSSEGRLVPVGKVVDLEVFAKVPEEGEYTLVGKVNYEGKETETRNLVFQVLSEESPISTWVLIVIGVGVLAVATVAGTALFGIRSFLRHRA